MSTIDDQIDEIKESSEKMHERMVLSARRAREADRKAHMLQKDLAALSPHDPKRESIVKHIELLQLIVQAARGNVSDGRLALDVNDTFIKDLEDGYDNAG